MDLLEVENPFESPQIPKDVDQNGTPNGQNDITNDVSDSSTKSSVGLPAASVKDSVSAVPETVFQTQAVASPVHQKSSAATFLSEGSPIKQTQGVETINTPTSEGPPVLPPKSAVVGTAGAPVLHIPRPPAMPPKPQTPKGQGSTPSSARASAGQKPGERASGMDPKLQKFMEDKRKLAEEGPHALVFNVAPRTEANTTAGWNKQSLKADSGLLEFESVPKPSEAGYSYDKKVNRLESYQEFESKAQASEADAINNRLDRHGRGDVGRLNRTPSPTTATSSKGSLMGQKPNKKSPVDGGDIPSSEILVDNSEITTKTISKSDDPSSEMLQNVLTSITESVTIVGDKTLDLVKEAVAPKYSTEVREGHVTLRPPAEGELCPLCENNLNLSWEQHEYVRMKQIQYGLKQEHRYAVHINPEPSKKGKNIVPGFDGKSLPSNFTASQLQALLNQNETLAAELSQAEQREKQLIALMDKHEQRANVLAKRLAQTNEDLCYCKATLDKHNISVISGAKRAKTMITPIEQFGKMWQSLGKGITAILSGKVSADSSSESANDRNSGGQSDLPFSKQDPEYRELCQERDQWIATCSDSLCQLNSVQQYLDVKNMECNKLKEDKQLLVEKMKKTLKEEMDRYTDKIRSAFLPDGPAETRQLDDALEQGYEQYKKDSAIHSGKGFSPVSGASGRKLSNKGIPPASGTILHVVANATKATSSSSRAARQKDGTASSSRSPKNALKKLFKKESAQSVPDSSVGVSTGGGQSSSSEAEQLEEFIATSDGGSEAVATAETLEDHQIGGNSVQDLPPNMQNTMQYTLSLGGDNSPGGESPGTQGDQGEVTQGGVQGWTSASSGQPGMVPEGSIPNLQDIFNTIDVIKQENDASIESMFEELDWAKLLKDPEIEFREGIENTTFASGFGKGATSSPSKRPADHGDGSSPSKKPAGSNPVEGTPMNLRQSVLDSLSVQQSAARQSIATSTLFLDGRVVDIADLSPPKRSVVEKQEEIEVFDMDISPVGSPNLTPATSTEQMAPPSTLEAPSQTRLESDKQDREKLII